MSEGRDRDRGEKKRPRDSPGGFFNVSATSPDSPEEDMELSMTPRTPEDDAVLSKINPKYPRCCFWCFKFLLW